MAKSSPEFGALMCSVAVVASSALFAGCSESAPTAPSDPTIGIHVYTDANFRGFSSQFTSDKADLLDEESRSNECNSYSDTQDSSYYSWDDCISSIRVLPGWSATVYEHPNFRGRFLELQADAPNLQLMRGPCSRDDDWNDCTSSIRVRKR
jgi:hypothetical protein